MITVIKDTTKKLIKDKWTVLFLVLSLVLILLYISVQQSADASFYDNNGNNNVPDAVCGNGLHVGNPHCITPTPTICDSPTPTDSPTSSPTPTEICLMQGDEDVQISCDSITPTAGDSATPTIQATETPVPSIDPTNTPVPGPTNTPTPGPTATPEPEQHQSQPATINMPLSAPHTGRAEN